MRKILLVIGGLTFCIIYYGVCLYLGILFLGGAIVVYQTTIDTNKRIISIEQKVDLLTKEIHK